MNSTAYKLKKILVDAYIDMDSAIQIAGHNKNLDYDFLVKHKETHNNEESYSSVFIFKDKSRLVFNSNKDTIKAYRNS